MNSENMGRLASCKWAQHAGQQEDVAMSCGSVEQILRAIEVDPDAFFAPPYQNPYESLCVADHELASMVSAPVDSQYVSSIARTAYLRTWETISVPELCSLVSDDVSTMATLLLSQQVLAPFTKERLEWYLSGRIPFGYAGEYPNGRWLVL